MVRRLNILLRTFFWFGLLTILVPSTAGLALDNGLSAAERDFLAANDTIVFITQTSYPPFEFVGSDGDHTGMVVELARWIATELGFKALFVDAPFQQAQEAVLSGAADVLTSLFFSAKRTRAFSFSEAIFEVPASIFVRAERPDIGGIQDLPSKTVSMQSGDYAEEYLASKGITCKIIFTADFAEATNMVIDGLADAVIGDEQIVLYYLFAEKLAERIKRVGEPLYIGKNCMAVRAGAPELIGVLNKGIARAREKGVLERIHYKWLGARFEQTSATALYYPHMVGAAAAVLLTAILVLFWNIHLRRKVVLRTAALAASENRLRTILNASPNPMVVYDEVGRPAYLNPSFTRLFGWTWKELRDQTIPYVPEDQRALTAAKIGEVKASERTVIFQSRRLTKQGDEKTVLISAAGIRNAGGRVMETVVTLTDITDIKRAEAERVLLATALHQAAETIMITDTDGRLLYANPAFERTSGYALNEVAGRRLNFLKSDRHEPAFYQNLWAALGRGEVWSGRMINKRKDDALFEEEVTISPVRDETGQLTNFVAVKRDVTHEVQMENQLRQALKMEAIGTLAGGIAHDFNNILSAVMGFTELGLKKAQKGEASSREHREVLKATERARDLIKHILTFSSKAAVELKALDLNQLVAQTLIMVERTIPKMIVIRTQLAEDLRPIKGDMGQLNQMLLNLCANAADAMPQGGTLRIETRNINVTDGRCSSATGKLIEGPFVLLTVTDTGIGISEKVQEHIFDPFFTTKPMGKGTGLGLSTVFGIVKSYGGSVICHSRPGTGAVFELYFPPTAAEIVSAPLQRRSSEERLRGHETILLVDDEKALRDIGRESLRIFGYRPFTAENGEQALEIYRRHGSHIDLVVLDLSMPGMGGRSCLAALLEINPQVKVIIASGYDRDGQLGKDLQNKVRAYLEKPYAYEKMIETIRTVLDQPAD